MRTQFDRQLAELNTQMIDISTLCKTAIAKASTSLLDGDLLMAQELPVLLTRIAEQEREIESVCIKLLLQQQPVAGDLRTVSAALKLVTDVQRIGTQSADIAEIVALGNIRSIPKDLPIAEMATAVQKMVTDSIDAFVGQNSKLAASVIKYDDVVDALFNDCKSTLIDWAKQPEADGEALVDLLMISKYFERIGDHAVNAAKWVLFSITGTITGTLEL